MFSTTKPVAKALAYRWGELQEQPPEFIDDLMIDLTTAYVAAQRSGDEERAGCLDEILNVLAEGIVKYERPAGPDLGEEALGRAIAGLRTYYYLQSGIPRAEDQRTGKAAKRRRVPAGASLDHDGMALS